ncbi:MAG: hypothetical protein JTT15_01180 [Candidatus Brockarchaeota archaeon]|nr:hypothetical protein [Candidatus Brockarchaeota archaeon]
MDKSLRPWVGGRDWRHQAHGSHLPRWEDVLAGINIPNEGMVSNLPDWGIIEVSVYADSVKIHPFHVGPLPKGVVTILSIGLTLGALFRSQVYKKT